jgi:hypothetical protein
MTHLKKTALAFLLTGSTLTHSPALAGSDEMLEKIQRLERELQSLKAAQAQSARLREERETHCMKAIGNRQFCSCVAEALPAGITFARYVQTAVTTKDELGYNAQADDQKSLTDRVFAARDACAR